jgi:signal transduction histidine kinase
MAVIAELKQKLAASDDHFDLELLNYRKDGTSFWNQLSISPVHGPGGELLYYFASQKDVSARRDAQMLETVERRLLKEIDHRAMNALALVQSIVSLSRGDTIERFSESIAGRVDAIARAHRLLAGSSWSAADLEELLELEVGRGTVTFDGPRTLLAARLVQPLSLVFHELFANAREHGPLAAGSGEVMASWKAGPTELVLAGGRPALSSTRPIRRKRVLASGLRAEQS